MKKQKKSKTPIADMIMKVWLPHQPKENRNANDLEPKTPFAEMLLKFYQPYNLRRKGDEYTPLVDLADEIGNVSQQKPQNAHQMEDEDMGKINYNQDSQSISKK